MSWNLSFNNPSALSDFAPPAIPTGLTISLNGLGQPVLGFKSSSDPYGPLTPWSGMNDYIVERDGTYYDSIPAIALGPQSLLSAASLGNNVGSSSQAGARVSLTSKSGGWYGTSDNGQFHNTAFSGDFFCCGKVTSHVSAQQFAKLAITARNSLAVNDQYFSTVIFPVISGSSQGYNSEYRTALAGSAAQATLTPFTTLPQYIGMLRVGNLFTSLYSPDGLAWNAFNPVTIAMAASVLVGVSLSGGDNSNICTSVMDEFTLTNLPDVTYTDLNP